MWKERGVGTDAESKKGDVEVGDGEERRVRFDKRKRR